MNSKTHLDWNLIHLFLSVAEAGSLSAAARRLGLSQPTLSRQLQALESEIGLPLFQRSARGLALTGEGEALVEAARQMAGAADRFSREAAGRVGDLTGDLRISVNEIVGVHLLPPALAAFREHHPEVQLELVIDNQASNLHHRDADLVLRMFRPRQQDLIARRLADLPLGFYAHRDYLTRHGTPRDGMALLRQVVIGFDRDQTFIEGARRVGLTVGRRDFALRTDNLLMQLALIRAGAGIGITHTGLAGCYPQLVRVLADVPLPTLEFWVVCHQDLRFSARVRALMGFLGAWFGQGRDVVYCP